MFGKNVHFTSDCEFFPNFDVVIKVQKIYFAKNNEIIFEGKTKKEIIEPIIKSLTEFMNDDGEEAENGYRINVEIFEKNK